MPRTAHLILAGFEVSGGGPADADYADYQRKIDRQIPVVVLEPISGGTPADDGAES
jgi:hypothetical protein